VLNFITRWVKYSDILFSLFCSFSRLPAETVGPAFTIYVDDGLAAKEVHFEGSSLIGLYFKVSIA
jgi:hypothetical protein